MTNNTEKLKSIDLYAVISSNLSSHDDPKEILDGVLKTGIKIVQLREKHLSKNEKYSLAKYFRTKTREKDVLLIINDDIDIAVSVEADGVHLGNEDLPVEAARKIASELIIGKSSHNLEEALEAQAMGADYINVGPIFITPTKQNAEPVGIELFRKVKEKVEIPITVMGGVGKNNLSEVCRAGADKIAMVRAIIDGDIESNVEDLYQIYYRYFNA